MLGPVDHQGRKAAPLNWAKKEGISVALGATVTDPSLPGLPVSVSVDVFGDGSGVVIYPVFAGKGSGEASSSEHARTVMLTDSARVDFTGWKRLTFRAPVVHRFWNAEEEFRRHRPIYPLSLLFAAAADDSTEGDEGQLLLDDLRVETQLPPGERLVLAIRRKNTSDFFAPGEKISVVVQNLDRKGGQGTRRTVVFNGRIEMPDGTSVANIVERSLSLEPGAEATIDLADKGLQRGAYRLACTATDDAGGKAFIYRPLVVMKVSDIAPDAVWPESFYAPMLERWPEHLVDDHTLAMASGEKRETVGYDWDLLEPYPQLFHLGRVRERLQQIKAGGRTSNMMLGFSAYWAAGEGYEQRKHGAYDRPRRHRGYTTDYWHVPEEIEDWDNFMHRINREVGHLVDVWCFWDNPDVPGLIRLQSNQAVAMLSSLRKWSRRYAPQSEVMLTGLNVGTAIDFLNEVNKAGGEDLYDIVNIKINPGIHPPEVWRFAEYVLGLQTAAKGKDIRVSEMDWPVEPRGDDGSGFDALGQARNLARMSLLCHWMGIEQPVVRLWNQDYYATGTGLTYRLDTGLAGTGHKSDYLVPRPGHLALMTVRRRLEGLMPYARVETDDLVPGNTHAYVYAAGQGSAAALWRVNGKAQLALPAGLSPAEAINIYGMQMKVEQRKVAICETPVMLSFPEKTPEDLRLALLEADLHPGKNEAYEKAMVLRDRVLPAFERQAEKHKYTAAGKLQAVHVDDIIPGAGAVSVNGTAGIEREAFELRCPANANMILKRRYRLGGKGEKIEVIVNGRKAGTWNLLNTRTNLKAGVRDAYFVVPKRHLASDGVQKVELQYADQPGTTFALWALSSTKQWIPLGQLAPIYAAQAVGEMRLHRNVVGDMLKIGTDEFARGIGTYAWSLIEYPLNGQFEQLSVTVGVDACSDGRGTVKFEVIGDGETLSLAGKKGSLAKTSIVTGLSQPQQMVVDVRGVDRLTLVVGEADDGHRFDAADWLEPKLKLAE